MKQLVLDLDHTIEDFSNDSFIRACCNLDAYRACTAKKWPGYNRILVIGEHGSGKTHLAKIWQRITGASKIYHKPFSVPQDAKALMCENIDLMVGNSVLEEKLFHMINFANDAKIPLLLNAANYPSFQLKDLVSRISATCKITIKPPDRSLLRLLIFKHFYDRQLRISDRVVDYLLKRVGRSFATISEVIKKIDENALVKGRAINIPLLKITIDEVDLERDYDVVDQDNIA